MGQPLAGGWTWSPTPVSRGDTIEPSGVALCAGCAYNCITVTLCCVVGVSVSLCVSVWDQNKLFCFSEAGPHAGGLALRGPGMWEATEGK